MRPEHPSSLSVSLSAFVKAQTSHFSLITKGLCQHTVCRPGVKLAGLSSILHLCNAADRSLQLFSLYPYTQFNSTHYNVFFSLRGCCISSSQLALRRRLAEAIYSSPSPSASPVGPRREEERKKREEGAGGRKGWWVTRLHSRLMEHVAKELDTSLLRRSGVCELLLQHTNLLLPLR